MDYAKAATRRGARHNLLRSALALTCAAVLACGAIGCVGKPPKEPVEPPTAKVPAEAPTAAAPAEAPTAKAPAEVPAAKLPAEQPEQKEKVDTLTETEQPQGSKSAESRPLPDRSASKPPDEASTNGQKEPIAPQPSGALPRRNLSEEERATVERFASVSPSPWTWWRGPFRN